MNDADIPVVPDVKRVKDHIYTFTNGFAMFVTNKNLAERDIIDEEIIRVRVREAKPLRGSVKELKLFSQQQIARDPSSSDDTVYQSNGEINASGLVSPNQTIY